MPINTGNRGRAPPDANQSGGGGSNAGLYPCSVCRRMFASDRIQHHELACAKANKQRRVFDSTKQRLEGTEAASFYRKARGRGRNEPPKAQVRIRGLSSIEEYPNICLFIVRFRNRTGDKSIRTLFKQFVTLRRHRVMKKQVSSPGRAGVHRTWDL